MIVHFTSGAALHILGAGGGGGAFHHFVLVTRLSVCQPLIFLILLCHCISPMPTPPHPTYLHTQNEDSSPTPFPLMAGFLILYDRSSVLISSPYPFFISADQGSSYPYFSYSKTLFGPCFLLTFIIFSSFCGGDHLLKVSAF